MKYSKEKIYYVYFYLDPKTEKPFYVGKGKNNRAWDHITLIKNGKNSDNLHKDNKIKKILREGSEPIIKIVKSYLTEKEAYDLEDDYIKQYGRSAFEENGILTNITLEGKPPSHLGSTRDHNGNKNPMFGKHHSEESKQLIRENRRSFVGENNPMYGKTQSKKCKETTSQRCKDKTYEELYGSTTAKKMKQTKSEKMKGKNTGCSPERLEAIRRGVKKREENRKNGVYKK